MLNQVGSQFPSPVSLNSKTSETFKGGGGGVAEGTGRQEQSLTLCWPPRRPEPLAAFITGSVRCTLATRASTVLETVS